MAGPGAGYPFVLGAGLETTFGTGVNVTDRIPVIRETLSDEIESILSEALTGNAGHEYLDLGDISVKGVIETDQRYTKKSGSYFCGADILLAIAMGGPQVYTSGWLTYFLAQQPNKYLTLSFDKKVSYWQAVSCWLQGFKLKFKKGVELRSEFDVCAHRISRSASDDYNIASLAANGGTRVRWADTVFRLGDQADLLAAVDNIGIDEATLEYDSGMSDPQFSSPDNNVTVGAGKHGDNTSISGATARSSRLSLPGERDDRRTVKLMLNCPRYLTDQLFTWRDAQTPLQFSAETDIDGSGRRFRLLVPNLRLTVVNANVDGPKMFPVKVEAQCLVNGGTSSGSGQNTVMVNNVPTTNKIPEEFQIEIKNNGGSPTGDGRTAVIW